MRCIARREFFVINIECEYKQYHQIKKELIPYFELTIEKENKCNWCISLENPKKSYDDLYRIREKKGIGIKKIKFAISNKRKTIYITEPNDILMKIYTVSRIIRDMFRAELVRRGGIPIHGGLVKNGQYGIGVIGERKSGKTTTILALLAGGFEYITNDDAIICCDNNAIIGYGSNRSISIRRDTILFLDRKIQDVVALRHSNYLNNTELANEAVFIKPRELNNMRVCGKVENLIFIFPSFDDLQEKPILLPISNYMIREFLIKNLEDTTMNYFPQLLNGLGYKRIDKNQYLERLRMLPIDQNKGFMLKQNLSNHTDAVPIIKEVMH